MKNILEAHRKKPHQELIEVIQLKVQVDRKKKPE
jgi:hypothetical protein